MDDLSKVTAGNAFLDVQYFHYGDLGKGVLLDVQASGLFSSLQGHNYKLASDDTTQITNSSFLSVKLLHFVNEAPTRFGLLWGVDFLGKYLTRGGEEGSLKTPQSEGAQQLAEIVGLGVTLGVGGEMRFLDDQLAVDAQLGTYLVYNSSASQRNSKTFMASGLVTKLRGRYYVTGWFFGQTQLFFENMGHEPLNANTSDIKGTFNSFRLTVGGGFQF